MEYMDVLWGVYETVKPVVLTINSRYALFPVLDVAKAIAVASVFRRSAHSSQQSWAQQLVAILLCCLGGTTLTGILLGQPPSWVIGANTAPTYVLGYLLVNYSPGDVVWRLASIPLLFECLMFLDGISWGTAITSWGVDKAVGAMHPQVASSTPAALLAGVLSGTGGGILNEAFSLSHKEWVFSTPPSLASPSFGIKVALLASPLYYVLHNPHGIGGLDLLHKDDAKMIVIGLVVVAALSKQWVWGQVEEDEVQPVEGGKKKAE